MWRTTQLLGVLVGVMLLAGGCGSDGVFIDPPAQPAVNRIVAAPSLQRWAFTYQPNSASPYLACLTGVDGVTGVVDLAAGAVIVEPDRNAPPVIVTNSSFLVPARSGRGWDEVRWGPNSDPASLYPIFGKTLAEYVAAGLREPDLNMTALALIESAARIELGTATVGEVGDTISVTVDGGRYFESLVAEDVSPDDLEGDNLPTFQVTADSLGRVTAIAATPAQSGSHTTGSVLSASYGAGDRVGMPAAIDRRQSLLTSIEYPTPEQSCTFDV